jgi:D-glycero-alpha-D-manno-heptose-7-phosphate kinase
MVAAAYFLRSGAIRSGLHLVLSSEVPPGTGLGSSSAMAVALIRTLSTVAGTEMTRCEVAELACHLEIELLGMPIGKQDQYASAYGGLNLLTFSNDDVGVRPVVMPYGVQRALDSRLLLFSTGATHHSGTLLRQQRENLRTDPAVRETMHAMKAMTGEMQSALRCGALDDVGRLLHEGWERKKRLSGGMTSERIDTLYTAARAAGALGGKITGAGGGGYLLVYCPSAAQEALKTAMASFGADELPFTFDRVGGQVVSNSHDDRSATVAIVRETRPRSKTLIPR